MLHLSVERNLGEKNIKTYDKRYLFIMMLHLSVESYLCQKIICVSQLTSTTR